MIKMIVIPLLLGLATAYVLYAGNRFLSLSNLELGFIAAGLFCLAMVLYNHFHSSFMITRMKRQISALAGFEKDLLRQIDELKAKKAGHAEIDHLGERLDALEIIRKMPVIEADTSVEEPATANSSGDSSRRFANDGKVVELATGQRSQRTGRSPDNRRAQHYLETVLAQGSTSLMLQPIVQLPDQRPFALEAFCAVADEELDSENGNLRPIHEMLGKVSPKNAAAIERETLNHISSAIRIMARNNQLMPIFFNVTQATLGNGSMTDAMCRTIKSDPKLAANIVLQFPMADLMRLRGSVEDRFYQFMELGVPFCASKCRDLNETLKLVRSGHYQYIKMDASRLLNFGKHEGELVSGLILPDCEKIGVSVIATGTSDRNVAANLIDNDILLAQGDLFSPPRPARLDERATPRSGKQAGK